MSEIKTININEADKYECKCGNTSFRSGFFTCDENGNEIEPTEKNAWKGLYVCAECGAIHRVVFG